MASSSSEWLEDARASLSAHYGVRFDSLGINLYRDGTDSVAWHRDRIPSEIADPVVALVSLGEPRKFLLRPQGGGRSQAFRLGQGDLLVTGGQTQRRFEHCVPKVEVSGRAIEPRVPTRRRLTWFSPSSGSVHLPRSASVSRRRDVHASEGGDSQNDQSPSGSVVCPTSIRYPSGSRM